MHWLAHLLEKRPAIHGKTDLRKQSRVSQLLQSNWVESWCLKFTMPRVTFTFTITFTPYWIVTWKLQRLELRPGSCKAHCGSILGLCVLFRDWLFAQSADGKQLRVWRKDENAGKSYWPIGLFVVSTRDCVPNTSMVYVNMSKRTQIHCENIRQLQRPPNRNRKEIYTIYIYDMCEERWKNLHNILNIFWIITRLRERSPYSVPLIFLCPSNVKCVECAHDFDTCWIHSMKLDSSCCWMASNLSDI